MGKTGNSAIVNASQRQPAAATAAATNTTRIAGSIVSSGSTSTLQLRLPRQSRDSRRRLCSGRPTLGILGETGAGNPQTLIFSFRFHDPTHRRTLLLIDGVDARQPLATCVRQVCIVLFSDTIGGNISLPATGEQIRRKFTFAAWPPSPGADGFILYAGRLRYRGRRTWRRPFRRQQRLSLARALADIRRSSSPDDTTSAVDMGRKRKSNVTCVVGRTKTIVTIAHRISSVKFRFSCSNAGRIVERGD